MQTLALSPGQSKTITITPEDSAGAPGLVGPNAPAWETSDATVVTVTAVATNGLSATVNALATATPGQSATVTVIGANSLSQIIQSSLLVNIQENPATQYFFNLS